MNGVSYKLTYQSFGEGALLINWPQTINPNILEDILKLNQCIEQNFIKGILETTTAYASLTIFFNSSIVSCSNLVAQIKELYTSTNSFSLNRKLWRIPVCYDQSVGLDMEEFATNKALSIEQVISLHSSPKYLIYFLGFLPGFPYLGGLPKALHCPRKSTPAISIPAGSVGIGGEQTGIYPVASPGGWHIIGRTPISIFNPSNDPPSPFSPGDYIQFKPIDKLTYEEIALQTQNNTFQIEHQPILDISHD